ncbi:MAG: hypothetical protein LBK66_13065 [Spirochaetaceae bacterium]|jgi:hypothetical protein|nr:hypothetical protein [Spirochaetaceae bacterium]
MAYQEMNENTASKEIDRINGLFDRFLVSNGYNDLTFNYNRSDLLLTIRKVDQRKHYFREFHNIDMSELKEISSLCFWLIKFKPYRIENDINSLHDSINEKFCVYLIIYTIRNILRLNNLDESPINYFSEEYIYELTYSLKFRDISKEALIYWLKQLLLCAV